PSWKTKVLLRHIGFEDSNRPARKPAVDPTGAFMRRLYCIKGRSTAPTPLRAAKSPPNDVDFVSVSISRNCRGLCTRAAALNRRDAMSDRGFEVSVPPGFAHHKPHGQD